MSIHCVAWLRNRDVVVYGVVALGCLLACGCSDAGHRLGGGGPEAAARGASSASRGPKLGLCADGADLESLDQMEDGDGTIDMIANRGGVWVSFNDQTGGTQVPGDHAEVFPMAALDPPRAASHFAARSQGGGFTDWGAGIGFELYNQKAYDVSKYAGITFWARSGSDPENDLRFDVTDSATAPRGGQCNEAEKQCSDFFGSFVTLTPEFQRYSFTWQELKQRGFGMPSPDALNTSQVYSVHFQMPVTEAFDFWIDDVSLLCHPD